MSRLRRLVINADDLGLAESVNRGIIEAVESGAVTSASLMVNMPASDDAARRVAALRDRGRSVGIGLHFNIVTGRPLSPCRSLTNLRTGNFLPLVAHAWRAWTDRLDVRDVERELDAQLQRAIRLLSPLGMRLTHIDSHQHAHCLPVVFEAVLRSARRNGISHVRHPHDSSPALLRRPHAFVASRLLRALLASRPALDDVRFTGFAAMRSRTFDRDILHFLASLPIGTTELMVHPGYDSPELAAIDSYRAPRERELSTLTSLALRERIRELGVDLTDFGATTPSASAPRPEARAES